MSRKELFEVLIKNYASDIDSAEADNYVNYQYKLMRIDELLGWLEDVIILDRSLTWDIAYNLYRKCQQLREKIGAILEEQDF